MSPIIESILNDPQRIERRQLSDKFLDGVIIPRIKNGLPIDPSIICDQYQEFCKNNAKLEDTFSVGSVWTAAIIRLSKTRDNNMSQILLEATCLLYDMTFKQKAREEDIFTETI